ncbi:tRNA adenosine(34) deaminase TadA [Carnobacteriaceae bacterium zg-C25]|nr:tRNA adenosine(34) deaminase TadA [Carnobacteriaceae bacterium zg-C25]
MSEHDKFMQAALDEAQKAYDKGEVPIGAVVVLNGKIIGRGHNLREVQQSATSHAEMLAIADANQKLGKWRLEDCTLYVTLEPCPMCSGAIILSRLKQVVYGAKDEKAGTCGTLMNLVQDDRFNHQSDVICGVMEDDCKAILQRFFKALRQRNKQFKVTGDDKALGKDVQTILVHLQEKQNDARMKHLEKKGMPLQYFGVLMKDVKAIAKSYGQNNALAKRLFDTHYLETELISIYLLNPKTVTVEQLLDVARQTDCELVLDELVDKVIAKRKDALYFEQAWQSEKTDKFERLVWGVRIKRMAKKMPSEQLELLIQLAKEALMQTSGQLQWQINRFLVEVAIKHSAYRKDIVTFGEAVGLYADEVVPSNCYRAYIPEWVNARI